MRLRGSVAPFRLLLMPFPGSATDEISIYSIEFGANFPHAFVAPAAIDDRFRQRIDGNYGFSATHIGSAILVVANEGEIFSRDRQNETLDRASWVVAVGSLRILVLGREGQVARSLAERAQHHHDCEIGFVGRPEFDLESEETVARAITANRPDVIVNAAAYTAVDRAEADGETAHRINAIGPALIAREAKRAGARLVHLSTDYVYDGQSPAPYTEGAAVNPINVYGKTKLLGEEGVRAELPDEHIIVRTSWVYSPFGSNFVKTMLALAGTRETVNVVGDQVGSPTSALDLAEGLLAAIARWRIDPVLGLGETYHVAGAGQTSWAGLAERIMDVSRDCGGRSARIVPISTAEYPTAAARPRFSILDSGKFRSTFDYACPPWEAAVSQVVSRLAEAAASERESGGSEP